MCNLLSGIIVCVFKTVSPINVFGCLNGLDMEIIIELLCTSGDLRSLVRNRAKLRSFVSI